MIVESDRKSFGDTASDRSELAGNTPSLKTWVTPKVITSSLEDTEGAVGVGSDGATHS
jgi:hypothetical protein